MSSDFCKRLVYWGQHGPTCWFNALLMATLYSQQSRNVILKSVDTLDDKIKIYKIFKHILKYKYIKSTKPTKDIEFFADIKPERILQMLNNYNDKKFMFTGYDNNGFNADLYIKRFYKLFNVDCMMLLSRKNTVIYDPANHIENVEISGVGARVKYKVKSLPYMYNQLERTPDILIIRALEPVNHQMFDKYMDYDMHRTFDKHTDKDSIVFNNAIYDLDAVILNNWNYADDNHSICGITCNGERYVYNGWTIHTNDAAMQNKVQNRQLPCELMKFDWNIDKDVPFCLNARQCKLDLVYGNQIPRDLCFSFHKGNRTLIYVKRGAGVSDKTYSKTPQYKSYRSVSLIKPQNVKDCAEGKIRDPVTKRCISMKTATKRNLIGKLGNAEPKVATPPKQPSPKPKKPLMPCKDANKIRDQRTGRCVSQKTAKKRGIL